LAGIFRLDITDAENELSAF